MLLQNSLYWQNYLIGIALSLLSTILFNIAPILEKEVLDEMETIDSSNLLQSLKIMFGNKKWVLGALLGVIGGLPYFIAVNLAGVLVTQPLMNFGFIILVIAAQKRLNEHLSGLSKIAIGAMIVMPLFILLSQVQEPIMYESPNKLIIFTVIVEIISFITAIISKKYPLLLSIAVGTNFAMGAIFLNAFTLNMDLSQDFQSLINGALAFPNILYLIIAGVTNISSIFLLQIGLQKSQASRFNPIQQTINNTIAFLGGLILFSQFAQNYIFYGIGFGLGILGVFILGRYE